MAYEFRCDAHTHTLYSRHAYSTIMENLQAARDAGLELLGSADHFSSMLFPTAHIRNFQYFLNMDVWPRVYDGVVLLRGAEADIVDLDGGLYGQDVVVSSSIVGRAYQEEKTLFERVSDNLDYLVASVHNGDFARGASIEDATRMYLNVLAEPKVFILGHVGRSGVPFDVDAVLTAARDAHKLIEINEHSLQSGPQSGRSRRAARSRGAAPSWAWASQSRPMRISRAISARCPRPRSCSRRSIFPRSW